MLCELCKKNEAIATIDLYIDGEKHEQYLCKECMEKQAGLFRKIVEMAVGRRGNMQGGASRPAPQSMVGQNRTVKRICPRCGTTDEEFMRTGRFGCPMCYETFSDLLRKKTDNGQISIDDKLPTLTDKEKQVALLERDLSVAVRTEQYMKAAQIRDQIKELMDETDS